MSAEVFRLGRAKVAKRVRLLDAVQVFLAAFQALKSGWRTEALCAVLRGPVRDEDGNPAPWCHQCDREVVGALSAPTDDEGVYALMCPHCLTTPREDQ